VRDNVFTCAPCIDDVDWVYAGMGHVDYFMAFEAVLPVLELGQSRFRLIFKGSRRVSLFLELYLLFIQQAIKWRLVWSEIFLYQNSANNCGASLVSSIDTSAQIRSQFWCDWSSTYIR
jgi:hypothetical protein